MELIYIYFSFVITGLLTPNICYLLFVIFLFVIFICFQKSVNTWWPNGLGEQNLYQLSAKFQPDGSAESVELSRRIGFRTVQVVQKYVQPGHPERGDFINTEFTSYFHNIYILRSSP